MKQVAETTDSPSGPGPGARPTVASPPPGEQSRRGPAPGAAAPPGRGQGSGETAESLRDQLLLPCDPSPALVAPVGLAPPGARRTNHEYPTQIQEHEINVVA